MIHQTEYGYVALGDCLDLLELCVPGTVDLVLTDLPYGVTANKKDVEIDLARLWPLLERASKPTTPYVFTCQMPFLFKLYASRREWFRYDLVWDKVLSTGFLNANRQPLRVHESILVFYERAPGYNPQYLEGTTFTHPQGAGGASKGGRNYGAVKRNADQPRTTQKHPVSVIRLARPHAAVADHPTERPVELFEWLIKTYTTEGAIVLDPTCGSGTTAVAAKNTGRRYIVMDNDPVWFEHTKARVT